MHKVVVLGGNGFVGQRVCQAALSFGAEVVSVNRSGPPKSSEWADRVRWVTGDIFNRSDYEEELAEATGAVSCVGAFGSNEFMERVCGDATVVAAGAAAEAGVEHFSFISAAGVQHPSHVLLRGYWAGKKKAEDELLGRFPDGAVILRASGIYGDRDVGGVKLPLWVVMKPAEQVLQLAPFSMLRNAGPLEAVFTPPVSVENVGKVAAAGALGLVPPGILSVEDINHQAARL